MIGLASGLLALAGIFAERGALVARRAALRQHLGAVKAEPSGEAFPWKRLWPISLVPAWFAGGPVVAVAGAALILGVGPTLARRRGVRERRDREEQLPDAVAAVAAGLRVGLSLPQALGYAGEEAASPLREDLERLVRQIQLGASIGDSLTAWADELSSEDARLIAGVLDLHRRSGGDLPSVLDGVAGTLRERRAANREVRALTAQARLSGVILGLLPVGFFGFLFLTSRREMLDAIGTPLGRTAIAIGLGLEVLAFFWIRRLLEVR